jgi:hypothetical protein
MTREVVTPPWQERARARLVRSGSAVRPRSWVLGALLAAACTNVLGIDGDYRLERTGSGGVRSFAGGSGEGGLGGFDAGVGGDMPLAGGAAGDHAAGGAGAGGRGGAGAGAGAGAGGSGSGGADGGSAGADASVPCDPGTKRCDVNGAPECVRPDPSVGCGLSDCNPCPLGPANSFPICTNDQACDFQCLDGYQRGPDGTSCDPISTGGAGGGGGRGGQGGSGPRTCTPTDLSKCPSCGFPSCCALNLCGCLFVAWCQPFG